MKPASFQKLPSFCAAVIMVVACIVCTMPAFAQWALMRADADAAARAGVRHIYNLEFDSARVEFQKVMAAYPNHPVGYFLDAMVDWWQISTDPRKKAIDQQFLAKIDKVIAVSDTLLAANENDIVGLFFKGGIIGFRGRYRVQRDEWLKAAADGKEALDIVMKCAAIAPGNKDVLLGTGIYHYFAETIPERYPLLKPALAFMPPGDKRSGIEELRLAAKSARYANVEAKVVLMQLFYGFERNYTEAMAIAEDLVKEFPKNSYFKSYLARCYVQTGQTDKMEALWREVLIACMDKKTGYDYLTAREAMYYIGTALMNRGKYDDALMYFYKCDEFSRRLDEKPSGWMVMLSTRIGNIYDIQNKRDLAVKQYNKVLAWDDYYESHKYAKQFLQRPYGK
jgi:tetratricopeptide (TPR) repeat protein